MSTSDELLILARRGQLSPKQRQELQQAVEDSPDLQLSELLGEAFEQEGKPRPGDAELHRSLAAFALQRLDASQPSVEWMPSRAGRRHGTRATRFTWRGFSKWWILLPLLVTGAGSGAALWWEHATRGTPFLATGSRTTPPLGAPLAAAPPTGPLAAGHPGPTTPHPSAPRPRSVATGRAPEQSPPEASPPASPLPSVSPGPLPRLRPTEPSPSNKASPTSGRGKRRAGSQATASSPSAQSQMQASATPRAVAPQGNTADVARTEPGQPLASSSKLRAVLSPTDPPPRQRAPSATELLRRAQHTRRLSWRAAVPRYQELISRFPRSTEAGLAEMVLAKHALQEGRLEQAVYWFRQHQRRAESLLLAEALWGEAQALELLGRLEERRRSLRILARDHANTPYGRTALGHLGLDPKQHD